MSFRRAIQGSTNALFHLPRGKRPIWFSDPALAMHPFGLNRIQPRAFNGQGANKDAYSLSGFPHLAIVCLDPLTHRPADMPTGVVPNQDQHALPLRLQLAAAPVQKLGGDGAQRAVLHKAQPEFLLPLLCLHGTVVQQQAVASQGFGGPICLGWDLFDQPQGLSIWRPGVQMRLREAAPPGFILKPNRPVGMTAGQADQPIAESFFRWYSGSGLVIHCLARFQRMPSRASVARMVSSLTRSRVKPSI